MAVRDQDMVVVPAYPETYIQVAVAVVYELFEQKESSRMAERAQRAPAAPSHYQTLYRKYR